MPPVNRFVSSTEIERELSMDKSFTASPFFRPGVITTSSNAKADSLMDKFNTTSLADFTSIFETATTS